MVRKPVHNWRPWDRRSLETEGGVYYLSDWAHRICDDCGEYESIKLRTLCDIR